MKTTQIIAILVVLVLGLFVSGCGKEASEITPTETPEETNGETAAGGQACNVAADCGEQVKEGEAKCIAGSLYQRMKIPRCTLSKDPGVRVCDYRFADERVGNC